MFFNPFRKKLKYKKTKPSQPTSLDDTISAASDDPTVKMGNAGSSPKAKRTSGNEDQPKYAHAEASVSSQKENEPLPSAKGASVKDYESIVASYEAQIKQEKKGKRKLFHSLVKLATELKRVQSEAGPLQEHAAYAHRSLWSAPRVLPGVQQHRGTRTRLREAISLSDLFFNLVIVTAFTRVGVAIAADSGLGEETTDATGLTLSTFLYFAIFWTIWSKEASYSTRFDKTDLSAQAETLVTCFAVLFASLSVSSPLNSPGGTRIMIMAAFCALLHFSLYVRVYSWNWTPTNVCGVCRNPEVEVGDGGQQEQGPSLQNHVHRYAAFNVMMNLLEALTWILGVVFLPETSRYRWVIFVVGILLSLRIPRAFMANDFHAACTKRGVLFILLLGFMLQSVVVVATDFFEYDTPNWEQYSFIGASCLMLFCIKLLYVDDSATLVADHALLVNRTAAMCFNLGQFVLLLSTTVMGSGLTLLTHSYLAAAAALPDHAKNLICGGFAATVFSTMFIKSMHLKRVPIDPTQRILFVGAYIAQAITTLVIVGVTTSMCFGHGGYLQVLMREDVELLWVLSGFALLLVVLGWLDKGLELVLFGDKSQGDPGAQSGDYLVHPFGFWWCLHPEVSMDELDDVPDPDVEDDGRRRSHPRLSVLSPLLGESIANMKDSFRVSYDSFPTHVKGSTGSL